jgi:hypothetical protein
MEESGVESGEVSPGAKAKTTEARPARPEASLRDFDTEARLGRGIFRLTADREEQRLTPYLDTKKFSKENLIALGERTGEEPITQEEVQKAKEASFGIALEAATQIAKVRLPRGGGIKDTNSFS